MQGGYMLHCLPHLSGFISAYHPPSPPHGSASTSPPPELHPSTHPPRLTPSFVLWSARPCRLAGDQEAPTHSNWWHCSHTWAQLFPTEHVAQAGASAGTEAKLNEINAALDWDKLLITYKAKIDFFGFRATWAPLCSAALLKLAEIKWN